jgi:hypothetical protein
MIVSKGQNHQRKEVTTMKTRRHIVHTSFQLDADFLAYYCGEKLVSLVVEGTSLRVNGEVDAATFNRLLRKVLEFEKNAPRAHRVKRDPEAMQRRKEAARPSDAVLPYANMREVFTTAYGRYERRWCR